MRFGLAGLGRMGVPMAERLLAADQQLVVWNPTRARAEEFAAPGVEVPVADSPAELLAGFSDAARARFVEPDPLPLP